VKLPQELAMNGDPDILLPILDFYSLYDLDNDPVIIDLLRSLKDHASVRLINTRAKYVDHLAHLRGERKTFHMDLTTGLPAKIPSVPEGPHTAAHAAAHAIEFGDQHIKAQKPPRDTETKDQNADPPFRYVPIVNEKERINRGPALSIRRVGAASDGCDGGNTDNSEGSA